MSILSLKSKSKEGLLKWAFALSLVTIFYNIVEGGISTFFGVKDETLALLGFGIDSFVEVVSGLGIAHMIFRMRRAEVTARDAFERTALKITGTAFYILVTGLLIGAGISFYTGRQPQTTLAGIVISSISIITMYALYRVKLRTGELLNSAPVISDARCTKTCFYLSFILLGSSILYELFSIAYVDAIGSLGIAWYAFREGREAFEKARGIKPVCDDDCC